MPYIKVEPDVFMEHDGVEVFNVYDGTSEPWKYWFTTNAETADDCFGHGQGGHFDARRLVGIWPDTPNCQQWDDWWKPRFNDEIEGIEALIRTAIDEKKLPRVKD